MKSGTRYLVVTCDGGGIRGVVSSLLLQNLGQSVLDNVDLFVGNSTGSIIAIALASGSLTVDELAEFYLNPETCATIFQPFLPGAEEQDAIGEAHKRLRLHEVVREGETLLKDLEGILPKLLFPMYTSKGLKSLLVENLRDMTLEQIWTERQKRVLAPTFRLHAAEGPPRWAPAAMHNLPNLAELGDYSQVKLVDAAMCSADPPILFEPHKLPSGAQFTDGALFANNPATVAVSSLLGSGIAGPDGVDLKDVFFLSVGTGSNPAGFPPSKPEFPYRLFPYGLLGWLWPKQTDTTPPLPLLSAVSAASSQIDTFQARLILGESNFRRANVDFGAEILSQTDCDGVPTMARLTREYMQGDEWKAIGEWVQANFS